MRLYRRVVQIINYRSSPLSHNGWSSNNSCLRRPNELCRRVIHKVDYRSMSTIYIEGLSTDENKYLCFENGFSYMANACVRDSKKTQGMGRGM